MRALAEEEVTITVRPTGPYRVSGPFKLVDVDGKEFELPDGWDADRPIALCRCGHSSIKPFCDSTHKEVDWCPKATIVD
jgi:CDGSH-type Zn-finger protein